MTRRLLEFRRLFKAAMFVAALTCGISVHAQITTGTVRGVVTNAQYVQAGLGALSNSGRNTLLLPAINNLDLSLFMNFAIGEGSKRIQLRADFYNAFNHPQYVPGFD